MRAGDELDVEYVRSMLQEAPLITGYEYLPMHFPSTYPLPTTQQLRYLCGDAQVLLQPGQFCGASTILRQKRNVGGAGSALAKVDWQISNRENQMLC